MATNEKLLKDRYTGIERAIQALQPTDVELVAIDQLLVAEPILREPIANPIVKVTGQMNALEHLYAAKKGLLITPIPGHVKIQ